MYSTVPLPGGVGLGIGGSSGTYLPRLSPVGLVRAGQRRRAATTPVVEKENVCPHPPPFPLLEGGEGGMQEARAGPHPHGQIRLAAGRVRGGALPAGPRGASRPWTPPPPRGHHRWWRRAAAAVSPPVGPRRGKGGRAPAPQVAVAVAVGGCWVTATAAGWGSSCPAWDGGARPDGGTTFFVVGPAHCVLGGMVDEWGGGRQQAAVLRGQKPTTPPDGCDWRGELKVTTSTGRRTDGGEDVVHLRVPSYHGATGGAGGGTGTATSTASLVSTTAGATGTTTTTDNLVLSQLDGGGGGGWRRRSCTAIRTANLV